MHAKEAITKIDQFTIKKSSDLTEDEQKILDMIKKNSDKKIGDLYTTYREQNGKFILTLKRTLANELACLERETIFENAKQMEDILQYLNYHEVIRIHKVRRKCRYGDYEICLDEVENLGNFIEVEKMSEEDGEKIQKELMQFLLTLGVTEDCQVHQGYDTLLHKKNSLR